jgi:hypothetical protein
MIGAIMWEALLKAATGAEMWVSVVVGLLGLAVSSFGLYYAYQALQRAAGAEEAAKAATKAANRRSAREELGLIARTGDDLLRNLEKQDWVGASGCSRQMVMLLGDFEGQHRGSELFDEAEFAVVAEHIDSIYEECVKITRDTTRATRPKSDSVHRAAREAVRRLARLSGGLKKPPLLSGG